MTTARFTSFATYKDLVNYIKCLQKGNSSTFCYAKGDNGVGASGKVTAQTKTPMCALPQHELSTKWGSARKAYGQKVRAHLRGRTVELEVADLGPKGVCDLNPAALIAFGLDQETELNEIGTWEWID
jgi:hypothetical protein